MSLPIRARLTAAFGAVLALVLGAVGLFVYAQVRDNANQTIDTELRARTRTFLEADEADRELMVALLGLSDERFGQLLDDRGRVLAASAQARGRAMLPAATVRRAGFHTAVADTRSERRAVRALVTPKGGRMLVVATALDDRDDALGQLRSLLWWSAALTFVVATALAWVLAGAALRPVERLRRAAGEFSATDLAARLDEPAADDEIRRLAQTLNAMLDRIEESFERQRSFVDHASHELRTPLANLSLELQLALRGDRDPAELRAALASAVDETDRLDRLASNLLVLARTSDGAIAIARERVDVGALVEATVATFGPRAAAGGVDLSVGTSGSGVDAHVADVDPVRTRQAVTNLVDNALRVTPNGGAVTVMVHGDPNVVSIEVRDTGPGFSDALRDRAFDTFVRGPAGERADDGAGLGLAIVAAVATAHGGDVEIEDVAAGGSPVGAAVTMRLPRDDRARGI